MSQLIPCSACQRHIRLTDSVCPFCNAICSPTRANERAGRLGRSSGLKRAAVFALSASVGVTACGGESDDGDTTDQNPVPVYGAPVSPSDDVNSSDSVSPSTSDPPTDDTDVGSDTTDPSDDTGLAQPEYGAPVPPPDDTETDDTDVSSVDTTDHLAVPVYGSPVSPEDDLTDDPTTGDTPTNGSTDFGDAGAADAGRAQDGGADGGGDGGTLPPSQDASLLDPDPGPTVVPLYGAPPQLE